MEKARHLNIYNQMVVIRRVEERAAELYQAGKIGGFLHLYIGQEAVSTGLVAARTPEDRFITAYRDHGLAINVGIPAKLVMAELLGKVTGVSKGRGGSMHMADVNLNFWGGHAIVGAHLPIAAGLALGDVYRETKGVTVCMFGDGATNIGYFHEALNLSEGLESAGALGLRKQSLWYGHISGARLCCFRNPPESRWLRHDQRAHRRHGCDGSL